jgi:hypothetical protein
VERGHREKTDVWAAATAQGGMSWLTVGPTVVLNDFKIGGIAWQTMGPTAVLNDFKIFQN